MKLKIDLLTNSVIKAIDKPVVITGESELLLTFISSVYALPLLKVGVKYNDKSEYFNIKADNSLNILPFVKAGKVEITVWSIVNGEPVKKWEIVPLTLIELTNGFELSDAINNLEKRVLALEEAHKTAFD